MRSWIRQSVHFIVVLFGGRAGTAGLQCNLNTTLKKSPTRCGHFEWRIKILAPTDDVSSIDGSNSLTNGAQLHGID